MRSKIGKVLRTKFDQRMKSGLPIFETDGVSYFPPGSRGYVSHSWPGLSAYIVLSISPKDDTFYIDVAWSRNGRYPHTAITEPDVLPADGDSQFRLNRLYDPKQYQGWYLARPRSLDDDFFTFVEESVDVSLERIDPALDDVFGKIKEHVLPYFDRLKSQL